MFKFLQPTQQFLRLTLFSVSVVIPVTPLERKRKESCKVLAIMREFSRQSTLSEIEVGRQSCRACAAQRVKLW